MIDILPQFISEAKKGMADSGHRQRMNSFVSQYQTSFQTSVKQFANLELAKMRAERLRWRTINHLDKYLIEFESNFIKSGGKVIWAQDMQEVTKEIINILDKNNAVKVTSCTDQQTEELNVNDALKSDSRKITETASAAAAANSMNKMEDAADTIRQQLHKEFIQANAGITTALFFIADPAAIVIGDNNGAALLTAGMPRISFVLAPIDRIVPSLVEVDTLLSLHATYQNGKSQHAYNTILTGPRTVTEKDGPEELYIILIDNGRTNVLSYEAQRKILSCINCGACLPASAIYKTVGGKSYPGPARAVGIPLAFGPEKYKYLADLATMDGSGSEACPVKISFPRLTLENRKMFVEQGFGSKKEKWFYFAWKKAMLKRDIISWTGLDARKKVMESYYKKSKEGLRAWPISSTKSFNQQWREKRA